MDRKEIYLYNVFIDISGHNNAYRTRHASTWISIHDQQDYTHSKQIGVSVFLNVIISLDKYSAIFNLRWRRRTLETVNK